MIIDSPTLLHENTNQAGVEDSLYSNFKRKSVKVEYASLIHPLSFMKILEDSLNSNFKRKYVKEE